MKMKAGSLVFNVHCVYNYYYYIRRYFSKQLHKKCILIQNNAFYVHNLLQKNFTFLIENIWN